MRTSRPLVAAAVLGAALGGAAGCDGSGGADPVVLRLGRQVVRRSDFRRHLSALEARGVDQLDPGTDKALFDAFVEQRVLVLEARERGYVGTAATADDEERAVERLLSQDALSKVTVSRAEIEAYYKAHPAEFSLQEMALVRQILVGSQNEARDIKRRIQQDPKNFEILARTLSRSPEAGQGGLMGRFARGEL